MKSRTYEVEGFKITIKSDNQLVVDELNYCNVINLVTSPNDYVTITFNECSFERVANNLMNYCYEFDGEIIVNFKKKIRKPKILIPKYTISKKKIHIPFNFSDEQGDQIKIYDDYRIAGKTPRNIINRAIYQHDNKFLRWLISSYPEDITDVYKLCQFAIMGDNAEGFRLLEQFNHDLPNPTGLYNVSKRCNKLHFAEYIKNYYYVD